MVFANSISWASVYYLRPAPFVEVVFLDIGQGDAIFIQTPQKHQVLIDGGPDAGIMEKLASVMPFYDRTIDLVILTHPDKDHISGLLEVLKQYEVENVLWTGILQDTERWQEWSKLIKEEGADIRIAQFGQRIVFSKGIFLDIIYPFENLSGREIERDNNTSVVSKLIAGDNSFLFTGDIEKKAEQELVDSNIGLDSDVLKVSHHGSKTSSSREFLETVKPEIAVIQVGKNNYGHPAPEVLLNLQNFDIETLRTDERGNILIVSDGASLKVAAKK